MAPPGIHYFAYGSNLCLRRFLDRVPCGVLLATGRLRGFALRWHKRSHSDGSGKCSVLRTGLEDDVVHGVLYRLPRREKVRLDLIEGLGNGYDETEVSIVPRERTAVRALTYVAQPSHVDESLRPFRWYRDLVLHGARTAGLPRAYVRALSRVEAEPDPDPLREARNRGALPCVQGN